MELDVKKRIHKCLANPRIIFQPRAIEEKDYVWISVDYSGQEAITAAVVSGDPTMCNSYLADPLIPGPDGNLYPNPEADMHTLTAAKCIAPELFNDKPLYLWRQIADKSKSRKKAKPLNFGALYLMTAATASETFGVKESIASEWLKNHRKTYPGYYSWAEEYGGISASRGFAICPFTKGIRWVDEENSKGAGESSVRASVNFAIQGPCAQMIKKAINHLYYSICPKYPEILILNLVHDEINIAAPGKCWLDTSKCSVNKDNTIVDLEGKPCPPIFSFDEQAKFYAELVKSTMEEIQTSMYASYGSNIKGRAEYSIGPYWIH
jgi:DNA polymerase I-like protein with 3'-5' exonuclease and polymerase domains